MSTSSAKIKKLAILPDFAARIITNTRKCEYITPLVKELKWLAVEEKLKYRDTMRFKLVFKQYGALIPL